MYASSPAAAALAATLLARLPVEAQPTVWKPNSTAFDSATATTRSLNDSVGKLTASFLILQLGDAERLGQPVGPDQRRAADVPADGRLAVERAAARGTATWSGAGVAIASRVKRRADGVVVVGDLERAEVVGAEVERLPWGRACRRGDTSGPARVLQPPAFSLRRRPGSPRMARGPSGRGHVDERQTSKRRRTLGCVLIQRGRGKNRQTPGTRSVPRRGREEIGEVEGERRGWPTTADHLICPLDAFETLTARERGAGVSTSIHRDGGPVAVASQGPSLSHSG